MHGTCGHRSKPAPRATNTSECSYLFYGNFSACLRSSEAVQTDVKLKGRQRSIVGVSPINEDRWSFPIMLSTPKQLMIESSALRA